MASPLETLDSRNHRAAPPAKQLNETVWRAWVEKGRAEDRQTSARQIAVVKWISIAALLAVAWLWSNLGQIEVPLRIVVMGGAIIVMFQYINVRRYAAAAAFGGMALLFNPLAPAFALNGDWQRALVVAIAGVFAASLVWSTPGTVAHA